MGTVMFGLSVSLDGFIAAAWWDVYPARSLFPLENLRVCAIMGGG